MLKSIEFSTQPKNPWISSDTTANTNFATFMLCKPNDSIKLVKYRMPTIYIALKKSSFINVFHVFYYSSDKLVLKFHLLIEFPLRQKRSKEKNTVYATL
jgi:hypothetical protein